MDNKEQTSSGVNQQIKTSVGVTIILIIAITVAMFTWKVKKVEDSFPDGITKSRQCTMEAKLCPDGSAVGRTGPNCEFEACPGDNLSDWKTYKDDKYGFELKIPADYGVLELGTSKFSNPNYQAESYSISSEKDKGFIMHIYITKDPKIMIGSDDRENQTKKIINGVEFVGFIEPGMGDRRGYIGKKGDNYFLLDAVFDSGTLDKIISTLRFTK